MKIIRPAMLVSAVILCLACARDTPSPPAVPAAVERIRLDACPETPNCVSSAESTGSRRYIPPLRYTESRDAAYRKLVGIIASDPRARIVVEGADFISAEFRSSVFGFVDDVDFLFSADQSSIELRSASRVGYYDFGVNRRRLEAIRTRWRGAIDY